MFHARAFAQLLGITLITLLVLADPASGGVPLYFEANRGQVDPEVKFLSRGNGYALFLTSEGMVLSLRGNDQAALVRMIVDGANPETQLSGLEELRGKTNYLIGHDPEKWHTDVPTYGRVRYAGIYPGIDMVYYGNRQQIEFDFVISPGADADLIRLSLEGSQKAFVDGSGDLLLKTVAGDVRLKKPTIYQEQEGRRKNIRGRYALRKKGNHYEVTFQIGPYDRGKALIIDPALIYSTLVGGVENPLGAVVEAAFGLAVDGAGNAYITGMTLSLDFPTKDPLQSSQNDDAFITKVNAEGTALVYSTYFGGAPWSRTTGYGIAVDASGSAYITGITSDIATTAGAFQPNHPGAGSGQEHPFVAKLNPAGNQLVYATYLAGTLASREEPHDIAVDAQGNAYITGYTESANFPVLNPIQPSSARRLHPEAFVTKLNATGTALIYSTPLGGQDADYGIGIAVDSLGRAYVTGVTNSSDFPLANAFQSVFVGGGCDGFGCPPGDAFVTRLNAAGSALEYSTYLGGPNEEFGKDVAVDASGSAYVTGSTWAFGSIGGFPTTPGAFRMTPAGGHDAFVTKFSPDGRSLIYSTYVGGSNGGDDGHGIAVDSGGNAYITGRTSSTDFPTLNAFQPAHGSPGGQTDGFVTELNAAGSALIYSSFLGGNSWDNYGLNVGRRSHIAVDAAGRAYVSGWTNSADFPTTPQAYQGALRGGQDAFLVKISSAVAVAPLTLEAIFPRRGGNSGTTTISIHGTGFNTGTAFRLSRPGQPEIAPMLMTVHQGGNLASAVFDLRGASPGLWDVVARKADGTSATLPNAFSIEDGGAGSIWTDVIGPTTVLRGTPTPFTFLLGNNGPNDAYGVLVFLGGFPKNFGVKLNFDIPLPPGIDPSISPYMQDPSDPNSLMLPLLVPVVRAGESIPFRVTMTPGSEFGFCVKLRATATSPLLRLESEGVGNLCNGLLADAAGCLASLPIPVVGCALNIGDALRQATCNALAEQSLGQQTTSGVRSVLSMIIGCATGGVSKALEFIYNALSVIEGCAKLFTGKELGVCITTSMDPNDKFGSIGTGAARYISGEEPLRYLILFENKPDATAPANQVRITDQLDPEKLDFTTFRFGPISFGDTVVTAPPGSEFTKDVDLRPAKNLIVRIEGKLDKTTGLLTWKFMSIDPATGQPTLDVMNGFLPPNKVPPEGDGSVFFTVMPREGLSTGTEIRNQARIFFDFNDPIDTPVWLNTIDNSKPSSQVLPLASNQCLSFNVAWSGTDQGSGIRSYTIFVSKNGGPFTPWLRNTTRTSASFSGEKGSTYAFYSVADDHAGNGESIPPVADVAVTIRDLEPPKITAPNAVTAFTGTGAAACGTTIADSALGVATASDNCSDVSMTRSGMPTGNFFPVGLTTLTYTVTDATGNTSAATQDVTVVDNTPPAMSCPVPLSVLNDSGKCSAAVTYTAPSATDNCMNATAACALASGSTFPVGQTAVTCTAADASNNAASCSFLVTVLGPRDVMQNVLAELKSLRATITDKQDGEKLDQAVRHLTESLDVTFWAASCHLQPKHGEKTFNETKNAVNKLRNLLKQNLQSFIDQLVRSAREIAMIAINDSVAAGGNPQDIEKARTAMARADSDVASGKYESGIEHYRQAWTSALKAVEKN